MEFARVFWTSIAFIGGVAGLLWLFKPGVGDAPSNWERFVNRFIDLMPEPAPAVMSRAENEGAVEALSSKDGQPDGQDGQASPYAPVSRAELLTLYKTLRKYGVPREEVRAALKGVRVPLSNDVWAQAAPAAAGGPDDEARLERIAERAVRRERYYDDPELEYQAPSV